MSSKEKNEKQNEKENKKENEKEKEKEKENDKPLMSSKDDIENENDKTLMSSNEDNENENEAINWNNSHKIKELNDTLAEIIEKSNIWRPNKIIRTSRKSRKVLAFQRLQW